MKQLYIFFVVIFLGFSVLGQNAGGLRTVVIDAGHGGKDPGATGSKAKEKDVTLSIALKLGNYIKENLPDVKVIYTRDKDVFVPLDERAKIANSNHADLFISIHANWISNANIQGTETFVLGLHRSTDNLEVAKKENSVIVLEDDYSAKYEGFDPNMSESYIIFELMQNAYLDQSISMASLVENQFLQRAGRQSRGVKQAGFLVLRETAMPSVLIETGFLTNPNEEKYISTEEGQLIIASAIFRAFKDYKKVFESKSIIVNSTSTAKPAKHLDNSVVFRIQIASSNHKIKETNKKFSNFSDLWVYEDSGMYKYTTGVSNDLGAMKNLLSSVKKEIPDAFIVAFDKDVRIPLDRAIELTQ